MEPSQKPGIPLRSALRLAAFFLLVGAIALALQQAINSGLRNIQTSDFGVLNRITTGRINAEIVITGSSRALRQYDSRIIQEITGRPTFNIGVNGSQTDMQLAVLKTYLRHNASPRLVVHNLDLFSFLTSHEIYNPAQYLPYLPEEPIYAGIRRVYPDAWKWKYLPLYGYAVEDMRFTWMLGLRRLAGFQPREDHFQGYLPQPARWTEDFGKFQRAHPDGAITGVEPQGVRDLAELIDICRRRGIPVLLVYSPEYYQMQGLERDRDGIFARFREMSARFGVPLWDYSDSPICRNRNNFYNSQHLNADGATAFSVDLARRLAASGLVPAP
jgi:hypothetical protein